jgi:hypothetical protein
VTESAVVPFRGRSYCAGCIVRCRATSGREGCAVIVMPLSYSPYKLLTTLLALRVTLICGRLSPVVVRGFGGLAHRRIHNPSPWSRNI